MSHLPKTPNYFLGMVKGCPADKQSAMNRQMGVLTDDGQGKQGQLKGTLKLLY